MSLEIFSSSREEKTRTCELVTHTHLHTYGSPVKCDTVTSTEGGYHARWLVLLPISTVIGVGADNVVDSHR